jgi:hypothetical protein
MVWLLCLSICFWHVNTARPHERHPVCPQKHNTLPKNFTNLSSVHVAGGGLLLVQYAVYDL